MAVFIPVQNSITGADRTLSDCDRTVRNWEISSLSSAFHRLLLCTRDQSRPPISVGLQAGKGVHVRRQKAEQLSRQWVKESQDTTQHVEVEEEGKVAKLPFLPFVALACN